MRGPAGDTGRTGPPAAAAQAGQSRRVLHIVKQHPQWEIWGQPPAAESAAGRPVVVGAWALAKAAGLECDRLQSSLGAAAMFNLLHWLTIDHHEPTTAEFANFYPVLLLPHLLVCKAAWEQQQCSACYTGSQLVTTYPPRL